MSKVIFDISVSVDGFVTASGMRPQEPLGADGQRLHEWAMGGDELSGKVLSKGLEATGALIAGRRTYDRSLPWWGPDGPSGEVRLPVFVVTHRAPDGPTENGVYRFVTDGIGPALHQARIAAGDKHVCVLGGPATGQQFIRAGLVDEIQLHLVPVLFGSGTRLFDVAGKHVLLDPVEVIHAPTATHLRYRVLT